MRPPKGAVAVNPTDMRGFVITPGAPVAYNLSGTVAKGVVESAEAYEVPGPWSGSYLKAAIKVRLEHEANGFQRGHVSTIRHPHNVLVLRPWDVT